MRSHLTTLIHLPFLLWGYIWLVNAAARNYTIDDTNGDSRTGQQVVYQPVELWKTPLCYSCQPYPDSSHVMNKTFHAASWLSGPEINITMSFSEFSNQVITTTAVNFIVDDKPALQFQYTPTGKSQFLFQSSVFMKDDLAEGAHTLVISGSPRGNGGIYVNFDYAIYTLNDDLRNVLPPTSAHVTTVLPTQITEGPLSFNTSTANATHTTSQLQRNSTSLITSNLSATPVSSKLETPISDTLATMPVLPSSLASLTYPYIVPTSQTPSSAPSHTHGGTPIILGAVTAVALFLTAIALLVYRRRRLRKASKVVPFTPPGLFSGGSGQNHLISPEKRVDKKNRVENSTENAIRHARQEELHRRLKALEQGIMKIAISLSSRETNINPGRNGSDDGTNSNKLRERMNAMRTQAEYLEQQRHSDWAAGLTDDLPPEYTAEHVL